MGHNFRITRLVRARAVRLKWAHRSGGGGASSPPLSAGGPEAIMDEFSSRREFLNMLQQSEPPDKARHLLRVAGSVTHDAQGVWTQLWGEIKPHVTPGGMVLPTMEKGFVPVCGWSEFLERMWLLKHYLDSMQRICQESK